MKSLKKIIAILFYSMVALPYAIAQSKQPQGMQLSGFKELLSNINGTFVYPDNFTEVKLPNNDKLPFQYGLKNTDADFEIWFQVNSTRADWQRFEKSGKQGANPDSAYAKVATDEAMIMSGTSDYITRTMPQHLLDSYGADEGRTYFLTLSNLPATKNYQYALLIVLQKNHYGNIVVACLTNEKGPAFFRNINKLRYCFKFNG